MKTRVIFFIILSYFTILQASSATIIIIFVACAFAYMLLDSVYTILKTN